MKKVLFTFVLLSTALLAVPAHASGITYLAQSPITRFDAMYGTDSVRITLNLPIQNPDNCGAPDGTYVTDPTLAGSKLQQATLLAAFLAGKQIEIAISGCGPNGLPRILNISVLQ